MKGAYFNNVLQGALTSIRRGRLLDTDAFYQSNLPPEEVGRELEVSCLHLLLNFCQPI